MIIATMLGGAKDGLEVVVPVLRQVVFPVCTVHGTEPPLIGLDFDWDLIVYVPDRSTLIPCDCRPDCPHATCVFRYRGVESK
jgi:hypothetical protein